jgi:hypothetical protein
VNPPTGPTTATQAVTVNETGFEPGASVTIGSTFNGYFTFTSTSQLTSVASPARAGAVSVTVRNSDGLQSTLAAGFTYVPAGGYTVDVYGGLHPYGDAPYEGVSAYYPGWNIVRGATLNACDPSGHSGWTVGGYGGMHQFGGAPT